MSEKKIQLVIVTGMSGAGKTVAIQSFEDLGYFTIDNMPPTLVPKFLQLVEGTTDNDKLALVVDMRSFPIMRSFGYPVVFDATHSVQLPGGGGTKSTGQRQFIGNLARAAAGSGIDGVFMEVHDNPAEALSDGPNSLYLSQVEGVLRDMVAIHSIVAKSTETAM